MTAQATISAVLDAIETIAAVNSPASPADGNSNTRRYTEYNQALKVLNSSSTPVVDTVVDLSRTLAGASESNDLTAAPLASDITDTVDLTGKKLVAMLLVADTGNDSGGLVVKFGATNGYDFLGASGQVTLFPGDTHLVFQYGAAAGRDAVGASDKTMDFAGTVGDEVSILALFGTQA